MTNIAIYNAGKHFLDVITAEVTELFAAHDINVTVSSYSDLNLMYTAANYVEFHLAFIELYIGKIDGFAIAREMHSRLPDLKVVFITAHTDLLYNAVEYLPIGFIRIQFFDEDIKRLTKSILSAAGYEDVNLHLDSLGGKTIIPLADVIYFEYLINISISIPETQHTPS